MTGTFANDDVACMRPFGVDARMCSSSHVLKIVCALVLLGKSMAGAAVSLPNVLPTADASPGVTGRHGRQLIVGCMDPTSISYNPSATERSKEADSCLYLVGGEQMTGEKMAAFQIDAGCECACGPPACACCCSWCATIADCWGMRGALGGFREEFAVSTKSHSNAAPPTSTL